MGALIPNRIIQIALDKSISALNELKKDIKKDEPFYAYTSSELIPLEPEGGYSFVFFIHNDLKTSNEFEKHVVSWIRTFIQKEKSK